MPVLGTDYLAVERSGVIHRATAADIAALASGVTYIKQAADLVNDTQSSMVSDLVLGDLQPNTHYVFEGMLGIASADAATGARPGLQWPSGLAYELATAWVLGGHSSTGFTSRMFGQADEQWANLNVMPNANAGETHFAEVKGQFVTGDTPSGSLNIVIKSEVAGSAVILRRKVSWLRWYTIP